ncbi:DNA alkylation repair protein [Candidatus Uhrbacteria bacterium]|nr:DNA alkylation repair protein [Candidatus Uhrbacteria bacterium]
MFHQAKDPHQEVERQLRVRIKRDPEYKAFREKTTTLTVLGLRLPVMRKIEVAGFSFYGEPPDTILDVWNRIWRQTSTHEVMSLPLFYYRRHKHNLDPVHWKQMKHWIERVENWEHADALCQLYSIFFERCPKLVLPTLRQWNRSINPWKRRASIVSTIYYASKRRTAPSRKTVLSLIEPLLSDKNPYVQKAVGWQLREAFKLWPREILAFLESYVLDLCAISFSYATERLSRHDKDALKQRRKQRKRT